jgi:hypothetical protein
LLVILVNKVVDPKRIIGKKWRAEEEERHKGSLTKKKDDSGQRDVDDRHHELGVAGVGLAAAIGHVVDSIRKPGANPTITSYSASVMKICNVTNSIVLR